MPATSKKKQELEAHAHSGAVHGSARQPLFAKRKYYTNTRLQEVADVHRHWSGFISQRRQGALGEN